MSVSTFNPPRQTGLAFHIGLTAILGAVVVWCAVRISFASVGPEFISYILAAIIAFFPIPFLLYRTYALLRSGYVIDRDNLILTWGLRVEQIPLSDVEWVRPISEMRDQLSMPWPSLPGSVVGVRNIRNLGVVEYLASERKNLLLVATARRIYAISPTDPANFTQTFRRSIEMGSLAPAPARSFFPSFILVRAWDQRFVRFLWLSGLLLNIGLFSWVSLLIPDLERVTLGFSPSVVPLEPVPGIRLMLLPLLSAFFFVIGLFTGLYFYRQEEQQALAVTIWVSTSVSALLFLLAVFFILITPI